MSSKCLEEKCVMKKIRNFFATKRNYAHRIEKTGNDGKDLLQFKVRTARL